MKSYFKILTLITCMLGFGVMMTSCDDRKDGPEENHSNDVESINAAYSLDLNETWFEFYDITLYYYDGEGVYNKLIVTNKWEYSFSISPDQIAKNYIFEVLATPKKHLPEIDKEQYILSENIQINFYGKRYDGSIFEDTKSDLNPVTNTWTDTYTFSNSQMKDFINAGTRFILSFSHSFDNNH